MGQREELTVHAFSVLSWLIVKITEYLESLVSVIKDGVQSRGGEPGCFVILTASSQLNLAVFTNKRYRVGTVVLNTCWLTDLITGSSIETRVVPAADIGTRDVISTWNGVVRSHDRTDNACTVSTSRCSIQSLRKVF